MRDKFHLGRIFVRVAIALDCEITAVTDHMCVGHDAIAIDDKTGANPALQRPRIPRRAVIRLDFGRGDADETFLNRTIRFRRRDRNWDNRWRRRRPRARLARSRGRLWLSGNRSGRALLLRVRGRSNEQQRATKNQNPVHQAKSRT